MIIKKNYKKILGAAAFTIVFILLGLQVFGSLVTTRIINVDEWLNDVPTIEFLKRMQEAQQGIHFLSGMILGALFVPAWFLIIFVFGKEGFDFWREVHGTLTLPHWEYIKDSMMDSSFWLIGFFVGRVIFFPIIIYRLKKTGKLPEQDS